MSVEIKKIDTSQFEEYFELLDKMAEYSIALGHPGTEYGYTEAKKAHVKKAFEDNKFEIFIMYDNDEKVGFMGIIQMYSTFLAKDTCYLDDIFILEEHRGKGYGTKFMEFLKELAKERSYGRVDWATPEANTKAQAFYQKLGAVNTHKVEYRFTQDQLK